MCPPDEENQPDQGIRNCDRHDESWGDHVLVLVGDDHFPDELHEEEDNTDHVHLEVGTHCQHVSDKSGTGG